MSLVIEILNPVYCQVNKKGEALIKESLSYDSSFFRQTRFGRKKMGSKKYLISKSGLFLTGLLPKVENFCKKNKIEYEIRPTPEFLELEKEVQPVKNFSLNGISPREDQIRLVENALEKRRGVLIAPTGTGKSILAAMIIKSFSKKKILLLCMRTGIINQFRTDLKNLGLKNITVFSGASKDISGEVVLATPQSLRNLPLIDLACHFDVVIVDEVHLAMSKDATYYQIMTQLLAPIRIGLTATAPIGEEKKLVLTGLFGELIDRLTYDEGQKLNILAKPILSLINVPKASKLSEYTRYPDIYDIGIVKHKIRNKLISDKAISLVEDGRTVLIFVNQIEHGKKIEEIIEKEKSVRVVYIHGETDQQEREKIRNDIEKKKLDIVISSVIWREGINVKTLGSVILAGGGKSEIATIQACGRGLRKGDGKEDVILVDLLDIGRYLSEHSIQRLQTYVELGWL